MRELLALVLENVVVRWEEWRDQRTLTGDQLLTWIRARWDSGARRCVW